MQSISPPRTAAGAIEYFRDHLATDGASNVIDDYYAKDGAGVWMGAGAAALELTGPVDAEQFRLALEGRSPDGQDLVQGAGEGHRAGWDCTYSAPKSVSALWAVADPETRALIEAAHDQAVVVAMENAQEKSIQARMGSSSAGTIQHVRGEMVVAAFRHGSSREGDPQLHTHAFLANLAQRPDGTWGALDADQLFKWKMTNGAIYRAALAEALTQQGLQIEADGDSFKVAGVPGDLCTEWSKRRQQIEKSLAEHGASGAKASEIAALDTRRAKDSDQTREQLHARWTTEALAHNFTAERAFAATATAEPEPMPTPEELLRRATEHDAVIEERHIWQAVAIECQHRAQGIDAIQERVAEVMESRDLVRLVHPETGKTKYTTRELYEKEREVIRYASEHASDNHHTVDPAKVEAAFAQFAAEKGFSLSDEQKAAVRHVTQDAGSIRTIVGDAGTGKSTAMLAARMAWAANDQRVIGCAISGKAAAGLQDGAGIESHTIASLLLRLEPQTDPETGQTRPPREVLTDQTVIVVDEAGMVDSRTMHRLIEHAEAAQARVVLVGDHKQLQAVGAGGVFRHLADQDSARISEIRRQRDDWAKEAVQQFSRGEAAEALGKFVDRGLVHVADDQPAAIARAVDRWARHVTEVGADETLMMASTNAEVHLLNQTARVTHADQLGHEVTIQTTDREGRPTGKLAVAEGDRLLAKRNDRDTGMKNGDLMTVRAIRYTADGIEIDVHVDRTKEIVTINPDEYSQLRYGYAVTTHAAQGATVDRAVVLGGGAMTSRESTYVQMSRMRETAEFITTRQQIRDAVAQAEPTDAMVKYCEELSEQKGLALPDDYQHSFSSARGFLNEHSGTEISADNTEEGLLAELRDVVTAMSKSQQKETTLDYEATTQAAEEAIMVMTMEE